MLSLDKIELRLARIPPLPSIILAIMQALDSADVDFSILERLITQDPGLAGRVVTTANSPFYGFSGKVSSLKEACLLLGFNTIHSIVLSLGVMRQLSSKEAHNLDQVALWQHSIGTAVTAKILAQHLHVDGDAAFTAALLHDMGKIVLDLYFTETYAEVIKFRNANDCLLYDAERAVLGCDHSTVGALLSKHWNLPETITNTIDKHHTPLSQDATIFCQIVCLSDIVCRGLEIGDGGDTLIPVLEDDLLEAVGISLAHIDSYLPTILSANELANIMLPQNG